MTYLTQYVFQIKQDLHIHCFNMITGKKESNIAESKYKYSSHGRGFDSCC